MKKIVLAFSLLTIPFGMCAQSGANQNSSHRINAPSKLKQTAKVMKSICAVIYITKTAINLYRYFFLRQAWVFEDEIPVIALL